MQQVSFGVKGKRSNARHQIVHRRPPGVWQDGFPIGNGFLGAMVWGDGHPLKFTLDCAELWDSRMDDEFIRHPDYNYATLCRLITAKRYDEAQKIFGGKGYAIEGNDLYPTKISIGRAELELGEARGYQCRLDIDRAVVAGEIQTDTAVHTFAGFVHRERNVFCLRIGDPPDGAELRVKPLLEICPALAGLQHAPPEWKSDGNLRVMTQILPEGPCYAVAWNTNAADIYLAVETAETAGEAAVRAVATHARARQTGFERLRADHERRWRTFWQESAVYLPEPEAEFYWYYGVYLLASSARRGSLPPGLQGMWPMDGIVPPWRGDYHNDMNVQETFWPACASGHLELLDTWCDYMRECIEPARKLTRQFFGTEGTVWPCVLMRGFKFVTGGPWYALTFAWSHVGWLGWLVWLRWRYSLDTAWLNETGYPVLSEIFKFYRANLKEEADGYLHVPLSVSPEYHGYNADETFCKDPNIDLALIRRCCDWVVEMESALDVAELSVSAERIRKRLVPYALTENKVLCLWPGKALDESHRHPSHLMAIHPAMDITIDGSEQEQEIIRASVNQFLSLGQYQWAGHTYTQMIGFAAVLGHGEWAYDCLRQFMEHWAMPNGLHINADWRYTGASYFGMEISRDRLSAPFTMEASNAVSAGISDMLVQGWNNVIRVFPAVPEHWRDIAFRDLRAEGAFRVSAIRLAGQTVWVRVQAEKTRILQLKDPFDGYPAVCAGAVECRLEKGRWKATLDAGQALEWSRQDVDANWPTAVRVIRHSATTRIGLK